MESFKKIHKALRTKIEQSGIPSADRTKEVIKFCNGKELELLIRAMETDTAMLVFDFLRVSALMEKEGQADKLYSEFPQDLLGLVLSIKKYKKWQKA